MRERAGLSRGRSVLAGDVRGVRHGRRLPRCGIVLDVPRLPLTMSPTIAVDLPAADVASPYAQTLLDACTLGTQSLARCVTGQENADDQGLAVAIVTWNGPARTGAHVEVGLRAGVEQRWRARDLVFSAVDPEVERWRTVGFAIATIAGDLVDRERAESRREPTLPAPAAEHASHETPPADDSRDSSPRSWLDALFSVEAAAGSSPAFGGEMRFARSLSPDSVFVTAGAACTVRRLDPDRLQILRLGASTGIGLVALRLGDRLRFTVRAGAALQLVEVTGTEPVTGASAQVGRWIAGLEEGRDGSWMASPRVGFVAGVQAGEATGAVDIRGKGQLLARLPAVGWVGQGGVRIAFP